MKKRSASDTRHADKRRDLARELIPQDARRAYLHPSKRGLPGTLFRMYRPILKNPRIILSALLYALSAGLLPLLGVLVVQHLAGLLASPGATAGSMFIAAGLYAASFFLLTALSSQLLHRNYTWFNQMRMDMLADALGQMMRMDYGLFENPGFMDDASNWDRSLSNNTAGYEGTFHEGFELGAVLVSSLLLGWLLGQASLLIPLTGLFFIAVNYLSQAHITAYKHSRREEVSRQARRSSNFAAEASDFGAGKDVRLFDMAGRFRHAFDEMIKAYMKLYRGFTGRELLLSLPESLALVAIDLVCAAVLVQRYLSGGMDTARLLTLLTALALFSAVMQVLGRKLAFIKGETLYVNDSFDFIQAELGAKGGSGSVPGDGPAEIVFEDVCFCYPGSDKPVLQGLNLRLAAGEKCALVGVNGAGKTTMVKLITGLYQPTSGRILINGIDAATLPQRELFRLFGVVFQETQPLAMTIAENVAASDEAIDRERVTGCLKTAGLWEKVSGFEKGIDTPMLRVIEDDGVILSGGENQKLMIARALYRGDTRMMVMDEPTAALDALAEEKIYREFDSLLRGRTALFISHRLASTRFCDRIVVLDGGRISQAGTHDELLNQEGLYREMFLTQGKYYRQDKEEGQDEEARSYSAQGA